MFKSIVAAAGAVFVGGAAFVLLYPVLGVTLWVSLLAAAVAAVLGAFSTSALGVRTEGQLALNPIVDVAVLRARYFGTLAFALAAGFMIVETFAFHGSTRQWIGFAMGIGIATAASAGFVISIARRGAKQHVTAAERVRLPVWDVLALAGATIGAWQIVQTLVFSTGTSQWLTFADGCALAVLALGGLVLHELSTERVVHALEVVGSAVDGESDEAGVHALAR